MATRLIQLAHVGAAAALAALVLMASCVDTRSDEFRCATTSDCVAPRTCEANWCVLEVTNPPDAAPRFGIDCTGDNACPDSIACTPGTSCAINCAGERACAGEIICAAGQPCTVFCDGRESCRGGIDCSDASECNLFCAGEKSCTDAAFQCGTAPCSINCSGRDSCEADIDCRDSCGCDVRCTGDGRNLCDPDPDCPSGCDLPGSDPGCASNQDGCNVCVP